MNNTAWLCHHLFFEPQVSVDVYLASICSNVRRSRFYSFEGSGVRYPQAAWSRLADGGSNCRMASVLLMATFQSHQYALRS